MTIILKDSPDLVHSEAMRRVLNIPPATFKVFCWLVDNPEKPITTEQKEQWVRDWPLVALPTVSFAVYSLVFATVLLARLQKNKMF